MKSSHSATKISHMPLLKIRHATTKTQHNQMFKKNKSSSKNTGLVDKDVEVQLGAEGRAQHEEGERVGFREGGRLSTCLVSNQS